MNDKKIGKSNKMQVQKLPTGIEGFDDVCRGGLPVSRSTLVSGTSGTGKTVFSLQYLHHGICNFDEPGIFVTFEESPCLLYTSPSPRDGRISRMPSSA